MRSCDSQENCQRSDSLPTPILDKPDTKHDLGPSQVCTLEALQVGSLGRFSLFHIVGVLHECQIAV